MLLRPVLPLLGLIVLAIVAASALDAIPERPTAQVAAVNAGEVIALTNGEREGKGIATLVRNPQLDRAAQMKAEDMAKKGYYAHVSPEGVTPMYWVDQAGYRYLAIGENLVVQRTDAKQVVDAFMGSPGHRANILRKDFTEIGVGVAKGTYKGKDTTFTVQIFAAPYPIAKPAAKTLVAPRPAPKPVATAATTTLVRTEAPIKKEPAVKVPELVRNVQKLVEPLVPEVATTTATSTASSTVSIATTTEYVPTLFLIDGVSPIELAGVSRLETRTTPVPVGSRWTMRFQAFVDQVVLSAKSLF